jgi:hypothetical protein
VGRRRCWKGALRAGRAPDLVSGVVRENSRLWPTATVPSVRRLRERGFRASSSTAIAGGNCHSSAGAPAARCITSAGRRRPDGDRVRAHRVERARRRRRRAVHHRGRRGGHVPRRLPRRGGWRTQHLPEVEPRRRADVGAGSPRQRRLDQLLCAECGRRRLAVVRRLPRLRVHPHAVRLCSQPDHHRPERFGTGAPPPRVDIRRLRALGDGTARRRGDRRLAELPRSTRVGALDSLRRRHLAPPRSVRFGVHRCRSVRPPSLRRR